MGMIACYMEADEVFIEKLKTKSGEDIFEEIEELEEEGNARVYDMDKMWDGLHFILTGVSATTPAEDNLLSEAVIGTAMFSQDEDADFISYIYPKRVSEIRNALNEFDIEKALSDFSPEILAQNDIYPSIWMKEDKDILKEDLLTTFQELKQFYSDMDRDKKGVIVSIY